IIPPYAMAQLTVEAVLRQLQPAQVAIARQHIEVILSERARMSATLQEMHGVTRVWNSDANFLLVEFADPDAALAAARAARLLVRDVRSQPGLKSALRLTIGSIAQNDRLLEA